MANKKVTDLALTKKKKGLKSRGKVELDKVGLTAAALGTFLIANEVSAAEDDKQQKQEAGKQTAQASSAQEQDKKLLQQAQAENTADIPAQSEATQAADASAIPSAEGEAMDGAQVQASDVPVANLDGVQLSAAPDTQLPTGVDAKTTMSDAGAAGGGDAGAGGAASSAGAQAGGAAAGAEAGTAAAGAGGLAGALGPVVLGSLPLGAVLGAGAAVALAVSGGGTGAVSAIAGGGGTLSQSIAGLVVDANVKGARVYYDLNDDNKAQENEYIATTNDDGSYTATLASGAAHAIIVKGGVDILTGQAIGIMVTPKGYTNVSPLTTLLAATNPNATPQEAQQFLHKLGLDGIDLNTYDPLADMKSADPAKQALALKAFTVSQQVYTVLQTAAELQAKATGEAEVSVADITNIARSISTTITGAADNTTLADRIKMATTAAVNAAVSAPGADAAIVTQLKDVVTSSLLTTTAQIQTDYVGASYDNPDLTLAVALKAGDTTTIAAKVATAAVGQTALTQAVQAGNTDTLALLSNTTSLQNYSDLYQQAIQTASNSGGTTGGTTGSTVVVEPLVFLTKAQALTTASTKFVIRDTAANLGTVNATLYGKAIGLVVTDTPSLTQFEALKTYAVSYATATVKVGATEIAALDADAALLSKFSIYHLLPTSASTTLSLKQAQDILGAGATFDADATHVVVLSLTNAEVHTLAGSATTLGMWKSAGFSQLTNAEPFSVLNATQWSNLEQAGFKYVPGNEVTLTVADGQLFGSFGDLVSDLQNFGIKYIDSDSIHTDLHFTASQAVILLNQGITFGDSNALQISASTVAEFKSFAAQPGLASAGIFVVTIKPADQTTLKAFLDDTAFNSTLTTLRGAAVEVSAIDFGTQAATLNGAEISALISSNLQFTTGANISYDVSSTSMATVAGQATGLAHAGVHTLVAGGALTVEAANAVPLLNAGLVFAGADTITVHAASGAELTSLINAAKPGAGLDNVVLSVGVQLGTDGLNHLARIDTISGLPAGFTTLHNAGVKDFTVDVTGNAAVVDSRDTDFMLGNGLHFSAEDQVSFSVGSTALATVLGEAAALQGIGVDALYLGTNLSLSATNLKSLFDTGLGVTHDGSLTVTVSTAAELSVLSTFVQSHAGVVNEVVLTPADSDALGTLAASTQFDQQIKALQNASITVTTIDVAGAQANVGISDALAKQLAADNLKFAAADTVTVDFSKQAGTLTATLKELQKVGVDAVSVAGGDVTLVDLGTTGTLSDVGLPSFSNTGTVDLLVSSNQLDEVAQHSAALKASGIDELHSSNADGSLTLTTTQAEALLGGNHSFDANTDLSFNTGNDVTLTVSQGDLSQVQSDLPALAQLHIDHIAAVTGDLHVSQDFANAMVTSHLDFIGGNDHVIVDATGATGTHMSTSLKDLEKLGVDAVAVTGDSVVVDLGGDLGSGHLPVFEHLNADGTITTSDSALDVTLNVSDSELHSLLNPGLVIGATGQFGYFSKGLDDLRAAGVDHLRVDNPMLSLTVSEADQFLNNHIDLSPGSLVSLTVNSKDLPHAITELPALQHLGVHTYQAEGGSITMSDAVASAAVHAGIQFSTFDDVTVQGPATGTHMATSLKELQKLGVDAVTAGGTDTHIAIDAGTGAWYGGDLPHFGVVDAQGHLSEQADAALDVTLNITSADLAAAMNQGDLGNLGVDHINLVGNNAIELTVGQANDLLHNDSSFDFNDVDFAKDDHVTLSVVNDSEAHQVAGEVAALQGMGVGAIHAVNPIVITETDASHLVSAGLDFTQDSYVHMQAESTHLHNSLKELQKLGVDAVFAAGGESEMHLTLGAGDIASGSVPHFFAEDGSGVVSLQDNDLHVTLDIKHAQLSDVIDNAFELGHAGIDTISVDETNLTLTVDDVDALLGGSNTFNSNDLQISAANDVTLTVGPADLGHLPQITALQGVGVDHIDVAGGAITINDASAHQMIHAGLDFTDQSSVTLEAGHGEGTHLTTSLKDLQKLGVDAVTAVGEQSIAVNLGAGDFDTSHGLPLFGVDTNHDGKIDGTEGDNLHVTLDVGAKQLNELLTLESKVDLHDLGIDSIQMHGNLTNLGALDPTAVQAAHIDAFTLDVNTAGLANLSANNLPLPTIAGIHINKLDVAGGAAATGDVHVDTHLAQAMIQAGVTFETADHITLDVQEGAHGTHFATSAQELHKLGVDDVTYHLSSAGPVDAHVLPTFDQELNVTLDVTNSLPPDDLSAATGDLLREHGIDRIEIGASLDDANHNGISDLAESLRDSVMHDGALDIIHDLWHLDVKVDLHGSTGTNAPDNLDLALQDLLHPVAMSDLDNELVKALQESGVTDLVVDTGNIKVSDGLVSALADAGMLHAVQGTAGANLVIDATMSGDHMFTTLKAMADLDVDHVVAGNPTDGHLYINLGELGQGDALSEVKDLLTHLDTNIFTGATTPTLVLDATTAAKLSTNGSFDPTIMHGLENIGIKEVAVLVGHNETTGIVAQTPTVTTPEVKIIGQDADPMLFDELHHPKH